MRCAGHGAQANGPAHDPVQACAPARVAERLRRGNAKFAADAAAHKDRAAAAPKQAPCVVVVTCSDSRMVVSRILSEPRLGHMFEVRTAGSVLGAADLESVVYAVEELRARVVLVLGHSGCGAVQAAIASLERPELRRAFPTLVRAIAPAVRAAQRAVSDRSDRAALLQMAVRENTLMRARELAFLLGSNAVVDAGVYDLVSGRIDWIEVAAPTPAPQPSPQPSRAMQPTRPPAAAEAGAGVDAAPSKRAGGRFRPSPARLATRTQRSGSRRSRRRSCGAW